MGALTLDLVKSFKLKCVCIEPRDGNAAKQLTLGGKFIAPAPVTTVCPSGEVARYSTLVEWPVRVVSLVMEGYFQITIWF